MFYKEAKRLANAALAVILLFGIGLFPFLNVKAADHAESTSVAEDPGADIADAFIFLDPNDNTKVVLAMTFEGFIVPSEMLNIGYFAPDVLYRFEIENTGDAVPDKFIDVTFGPQTSRSSPQTATIEMSGRKGIRKPPFFAKFTAPTTVSDFNATPPPFVVTRDTTSGISFFAGMTDDPFYFDIVGFNRFTSSVTSGSPNASFLQRSRDSFAGYNIHAIAIEVPASMLRGSAGNMVGLNAITMRQRNTLRQNSGEVIASGDYVQVDRMGIPALNTVLINYPRKNEYNASTPQDDANGKFTNTIVSSLTSLGTSQSNIVILANIAVFRGDMLRLNLDTANTGNGFGERITSANYTGFPNGRRLGDDTVDTLMYFITNQSVLTGDNVNSNDMPLTNTFPFFGKPNPPLENPAVDPTRN